MIVPLAMMLGLAAETPAPAPDRFGENAALFASTCLSPFPDDKAVIAAMTRPDIRVMPEKDVRITMRDDPARAWIMPDGQTTVWIEFPPYHACSVRWSQATVPSESRAAVVTAEYRQKNPGFVAGAPYDTDQGVIHIHAETFSRVLSDGTRETLMMVDKHITDPAMRAKGNTGVTYRFVHQFAH